MTPKWYALSAEEAVKRLNSNAAAGLSHKAARLRCGKKRFSGEFDFYFAPKTTLRTVVGSYASDILFWTLLLTCGALSFFEDTRLATVGLLYLALNFTVAVVTAKHSAAMSETVSLAFVPNIRVIREGKLLSIDYRLAVPGDIVLLSAGDTVPFDARILSSDRLRVSVCCGTDEAGKLRFSETEKDGSVTLESSRDLTPEKRTNMVTAGSTVLSGSARVLVVETGAYTYIGALLGGFPICEREKQQKSFVRSVCRWLRYVGVLFLILMIPLMGLSLFLGESGSLAISFLTVLSLSVSFFPGWIVSVLELIAIRGLRKAAADRDALLRNSETAEALAEADVLLLFGKPMLTDGFPHVAAVFSEGRFHTGKALRSPACRRLAEWGAFLALAESELPSADTQEADRNALFRKELLQYAEFVGVDRAMLRIRFRRSEYRAPAPSRPFSALCYTEVADGADGEVRMLLSSADPSFYLNCTHLQASDGIVRMTPDRQYELSERIRGDLTRGSDVHLYAERRENGDVVFLGYIAYAERFSPETRTAMAELSSSGIRTLLFLSGESVTDRCFAVSSGCAASEREIALASDFRKQDHMIYDGFGGFGAYLGFSEEEVSALICHLSDGGLTVCSVAIDDDAEPMLSLSDVSVVCGDVRAVTRRKTERELEELPISGAKHGREAPGKLRLGADAVVRRMSLKGGGLPALSRVISLCKRIVRSRETFLSYLTVSLALRIGMLLPSFIGLDSLFPAAALLFVGAILDLCAGIVIAHGDRTIRVDQPEQKGSARFTRREAVRAAFAFMVGILLSLVPFAFPLFGADASASVSASFRSAALILALLFFLIRIRFLASGVRPYRSLLCLVIPTVLLLIVAMTVRAIGVCVGISVFPGFALVFLPLAVLLPWLLPIGK